MILVWSSQTNISTILCFLYLLWVHSSSSLTGRFPCYVKGRTTQEVGLFCQGTNANLLKSHNWPSFRSILGLRIRVVAIRQSLVTKLDKFFLHNTPQVKSHKILEKYYEKHRHILAGDKPKLAEVTQMTEAQVKNWIGNRRSRDNKVAGSKDG